MKKQWMLLIVLVISSLIFVLLGVVSAESGFKKTTYLKQSGIVLPVFELSEDMPEFPVKEGKLKPTKTKSLESINETPSTAKAKLVQKVPFSVRVRPHIPAIFSIDAKTGKIELDERNQAKNEFLRDYSIDTAADLIESIDDTWREAFLARMDAIDQQRAKELSNMLLINDDDFLNDEIAWVLSHMTPEDLANTNLPPITIKRNAELIYEQAKRLNYVDIVELPDGHTTLKYLIDPHDYVWQLPYKQYYSMVVNMKMDWEEVELIDPTTGKFAAESDGGVFWREYFLNKNYSAKEDEFGLHIKNREFDFKLPKLPQKSQYISRLEEKKYRYTVHPILKSPNDLHGENFPKLHLYENQSFVDVSGDPLKLIVNSNNNTPALYEKVIGIGAVIATIIPVDDGLNNTKKLLQNMLMHLSGMQQISKYTKIVIVQDKKQFGNATIKNQLQILGNTPTIIKSDEIETMDLEGVKKIIIPSDQPIEFYQAIQNHKKIFEDFVRAGGTLQFHGAISHMDNNWSGLDMPTGFSMQIYEGDHGELVEGGFPQLTDLFHLSNKAWDTETHVGLSGERLFDPASFAIDILGYWGSQNLYFNIAEIIKIKAWGFDRANQPVRIAYNHYGNCGEIQDILTSGGRSMLLPMINVHDGPEDHVWAHIYLRDSMIPFQFDWSDGATRINNHGISYEKRWGSGKDCSCIIASEGDGTIRSVSDKYSDHVTFDLEVVDKDGNPVDSAKVMIATEVWQNDAKLTMGYWGETDDRGRFSVKLGDNQNYYLRVETVFESLPATTGQVSQIIKAADATPGKDFSLKLEMTKSLDEIWNNSNAQFVSSGTGNTIRVSASNRWSALVGTNLYTDQTTFKKAGKAKARWLLLDDEQLNKYLGKQGYYRTSQLVENSGELDISGKDKWYLLLVPDSYGKEAVFEGSIATYGNAMANSFDEDYNEAMPIYVSGATSVDGDIDGEQVETSTEKDDGGCNSTNASFWWILLLIPLLLRSRIKA